eukprot:CAMPEP_0176491844 /NCGR_PEP_ID=MMETSP0200_2-20121128/8652_1 /TAXON_ID=947934 /ORGANISM="Chaetoceros sp., Strain GSL56" /LENGTH=636 /DNA_ID=CAMNT_0017889307 /DNA_START=158 /DNA_END=2068 /DNA_ORIENTATION=+
MSAIKNLFRNGGGESLDRQLELGYGVMIITCLVEADGHSKAAVQKASKLGFRMRKTLSDKSLTASSVARDIVEGNTNYIRYLCDSISGGASCNVTLSYGYGPPTNVIVRYDETLQTENCFVGRLLLLVELPENEMTSVVPPQDSLYHQIQSCSSFPPEVYISPSAKIWDASLLYNSAQQNELVSKTIHVKINTVGDIYFVEYTEGSPIAADSHPTKVTSVPSDHHEKSDASREKVPAVSTPASKDKESTTVTCKRKVTDKANVKESSKKPRVAAAKKSTTATTEQLTVDTSAPKKTKGTGTVSPTTPTAHAKQGREVSSKSPTTRSQSTAKPSERNKANETNPHQDIGKGSVAVEKQTKKATAKSKNSKMSDVHDEPGETQGGESLKNEKVTVSDEKKPVKETSQGKAAKKKDSNGPKRSLSSYMLFCQDHRQDIVKRNPDKSFTEIGMMLGAAYKELAPKEKARYIVKAQELRKQHEIDKKEYDEAHNAEHEVAGEAEAKDAANQKEVTVPTSNKNRKKRADGEDEVAGEADAKETANQKEVAVTTSNTKRKKKAKKDPNAPKRANSAYMIFCSAKRQQLLKSNPGITIPETGKVLGKMWNDATAKEKEKFNKLAANDKKRYEDEMKAYKPVDSA